MKRSLLAGLVVVGAAASIAVAYSRLTVAAPAPAPAANAAAQSATPAGSTASSVEATARTASSESAALSPSPETARLEQRRLLYETVDALLQASEFESARKLLDEDQERHGDDLAPEWRDLEQGYRLIADCLEHPSPKYRARAQAFLLVSEAVTLAPQLRAACEK